MSKKAAKVSKKTESQISDIEPMTRVEKMSKSKEKLNEQLTAADFGNLFDCIGLVIFCIKDKNMILSKFNKDKGLWFPICPVRPTEPWHVTCINRMKRLLTVSLGAANKNHLGFSIPELFHTLRLQVPGSTRFITRVLFISQLNHDPKFPTTCCQNTEFATWYSIDQLLYTTNIKNLWGPEPLIFISGIMNMTFEKGCYAEFSLKDAARFNPRINRDQNQQPSFQSALLATSTLTDRNYNRIYAEYLQHCFPSQFLNCFSFVDYINKLDLGYDNEETFNIYRAFSINGLSYLTFHEFLLGFAAMDQKTKHEGQAGDMRTGFIFRYYDVNCDTHLGQNEIFKMATDLLKLRVKTPIDKKMVEDEMIKIYAALGVGPEEPIKQDMLIAATSNPVFVGFSKMLRFPVAIMQQIQLKSIYSSVTDLSTLITDRRTSKRTKGTCNRCKFKKYTLAVHCIKITRRGGLTESICLSEADCNEMTKEKRTLSVMNFNPAQPENVILSIIRKCADPNAAANIVWFNTDTMREVLKILQDAEVLFKTENRCVRVCSPCYVMGDIHGNIHDVLIYEKLIWSRGPVCSEGNYLFLGDIVDRGDYGVECTLYLFCMKLLAPTKFFILRGNHELRAIQAVFTFQAECVAKFGKANGQMIWESFNKVFDCMPICGVIDDKIFCSHGGIPQSVTRIEELNMIPCPLPDPEQLSSPAWEMLWNDPVTDAEFGNHLELYKEQSGSQAIPEQTGFIPNTKRGTAYFFSEKATNKFLSTNDLSHIIRAHEVNINGYNFHMSGRVITIFSSSKYCNGNNEAACIFIENEKLRILKIDTND